MAASIVNSNMTAATQSVASSCANVAYLGTAYAVLFFVLAALLGGFFGYFLLLAGGLLLFKKRLMQCR